MNTPGEKPAIGIEIVGDNLVLVLYYHRNDAKPDDKVFIFDWRTAVIKMVGLRVHFGIQTLIDTF